MDSRSRRNFGQLNNELQDVQRIMVQNIDDVLTRGEALSGMATGYWYYRVVQNKLDYLLLLSQILYFYNKTYKYDNLGVAPRTLVKAVLSVSSTGCNE